MNRSFARTRSSFCTIIAVTLAACGGGGGNRNFGVTPPMPPSPPVGQSGVLVDSPVAGLRYDTPTFDGSTDVDGRFAYATGESVTFSIGDIEFPAVAGGSLVSPFDLAATTDTTDTALVNMTRLLQTLDTDGNVDNGITIDDAAHAFATGMTLDFASPTFDADVANLISNSGSVNTMLVDAGPAIDHLVATIDGGGSCASTASTVGWVADLVTIAHGVSGQATIVDDCTIRIDNFNYDGQGLNEVRIYGGLNGDYVNGFSIGENLFGTVYTDATLILTLPQTMTLADLNGISVWCVEAQANFGSGTFAPP